MDTERDQPLHYRGGYVLGRQRYSRYLLSRDATLFDSTCGILLGNFETLRPMANSYPKTDGKVNRTKEEDATENVRVYATLGNPCRVTTIADDFR